jgi:hypothetical protein
MATQLEEDRAPVCDTAPKKGGDENNAGSYISAGAVPPPDSARVTGASRGAVEDVLELKLQVACHDAAGGCHSGHVVDHVEWITTWLMGGLIAKARLTCPATSAVNSCQPVGGPALGTTRVFLNSF